MQKLIHIKSKRTIIAAILSIASIVLCNITIGSVKSGLFFAFLFLASGVFNVRGMTPKRGLIHIFPWLLLASFVTLFLSQLIQNELLFALPLKQILLGEICCFVPILLLFAITMRPLLSAFLIAIMFLLSSTANYFVYAFRSSELCPADILTIGTALNVASQYTYKLSNPVLYAWLLFGVFVFFSTGLPIWHSERRVLYRILPVAVSICLCTVFPLLNKELPTQHFLHGGSFYNGFILNFMKEIPEIIIHKPNEYSPKLVSSISTAYVGDEEEKNRRNPDIVVIMDEAYSDLSVIGDELNTNISVSPYIHSLRKNTCYGYTLSSAYGGGTPNSEYEFLTGNTLLFINGIVYQQYLREPSYSLVSVLKNQGYKCIAMHPYLANGWKRNTVWPNLLFDECLFLESFPQKNLLRGLVSDREMFDVLLDTYETEKANSDKPVFLFGVTMQNHSSYDYDGEDFQTKIQLNGYSRDYPDVEQYLSLVHETDRAVEYLLNRLEAVEQDVIVLFYGDHQPAVDEAFLQEIHGGSFETLNEKQLLQMVPFFIWTNYESKTEEISITSLNYLSTRLLQKAGLPLPAYNLFLDDVEEKIPAMNVKGYYSIENGEYKPLNEADGREKTILDQYWMVEYNSLFDLKNLDTVFFPLGKYEDGIE